MTAQNVNTPFKAGPKSVKASAVLPGSGAYDTPAITLDVTEVRKIKIFATYTRVSGQAGALKIKKLGSPDSVAFGADTILDGTTLSSGSINSNTEQVKFQAAAGDSAEVFTHVFNVEGDGWVKIAFAEYGATSNPGTVSAVVMLIP